MSENSIVLFKDGDVSLDVPISPERDTVLLNRSQMALLVVKPTVENFATVQNGGGRQVERSIACRQWTNSNMRESAT